jgi:predicted dehydrogenase
MIIDRFDLDHSGPSARADPRVPAHEDASGPGPLSGKSAMALGLARVGTTATTGGTTPAGIHRYSYPDASVAHMETNTVAIVGTGANPESQTVEGFSMAYQHADAYRSIAGCELVACVDIVRENAEAFAEAYGLGAGAVFEDTEAMLRDAEPDIVSVCVPPAVHAEVVVTCAESDIPGAIHCEKPMAQTWGDARRMAATCERADVQLTFNHQRRFGDLFRGTRELIERGEIGDLRRVAYTWGDFFDNGTHCIDMCNYFTDETPVEWVLGGLDYREEDVRFGAHSENQMLAQWRYENGVYGLASTGGGAAYFDGDWHLEGTDGAIEVHLTSEKNHLRVRRDGEGWERIDYPLSEPGWIERAIDDVVAAYREDRPSELRADNALNATRIIFGGYESVRRSGRVDFPLDVEDNPLESMVDGGRLQPMAGE